MKALTLWRPWSWAIVVCGKSIENRSWPPPSSVIGERILFHNSQRWDADGCKRMEFIAGRPAPRPESCPLMDPGRIVASAVIAGAVRRNESPDAVTFLGPFREEDRFDPHAEIESCWAFGPWCWVLREIREERGPVVRGRQGLWESTWRPA